MNGLQITTYEQDSLILLRIRGRLDEASGKRLCRELDECVSRASTVIVNCGGMEAGGEDGVATLTDHCGSLGSQVLVVGLHAHSPR